MGEFLGALGFNNETMVFEDTTNFGLAEVKKARYTGEYTDVVPSGPESAWKTPPFTATGWRLSDGRGAADMKAVLPLC